MADTAESSSQSPVPQEDESPVPLTPAKKGAKPATKPIGVKKPSIKHPATSELVLNAIKTLQDRNGSSLQAIKKFIATNYKLDTDKLAPFIKKYLKNAVGAGKLIQTKGKGASGSFKLPATPAAKSVNEKKKKLTKPKVAEKKVKMDGKKDKKKKEKLTTTAATTTATAIKTSAEKKKHASLKKGTKKSSASIKSLAAPKQKSTKPSKVASKVKAPKTKKAPSVKKAASGGTEKKAHKTAKAN